MVLKAFLPPSTSYVGIDKKNGNTIKHDLEMGLPSEIKNETFDVIFMNEFIEHIEHFKTLLMDCRNILSKKGRIIISTSSNNRILYGDFSNGTGRRAHSISLF